MISYRGRKHSIEVDKLEKKYKDWQKKLHPDLVHAKSQVICSFYDFFFSYGKK